MSKKSIKEIYSDEISELDYLLTQLENNQVYEFTNAKSDGSLSHNAHKLRKMIAQLIIKIDKEKPSDGDLIDPLFDDNKK